MVVLTNNEAPKVEAFGARQQLATLKVSLDSSYPTGGEPLDLPKLTGIRNITHVLSPIHSGYQFRYDAATKKLLAYYPTNMGDLTFTGTAPAAHTHTFVGDAPAAHGHAFTGTALAAQTLTVKDDDTAASLGTAVSARMLNGLFANLESQNAGGADSNFATSGGRLSVFVPRRHSFNVSIEDLGAGVDITARSVWAAPASGAVILQAGIVGSGSPAGMDAGNACVVLLRDAAGNAIATKTYDDSPVFPADGVYDSLGAIDATHGILTGNEVLQVSVTNGAAADPPPFIIVLEWEEQEALFPVYFDEDAAAGSRFLINNTVNGLDLYVVASDGRLIKLTHNADPATPGVRCYFDDDGVTAAEKLVFVSPTNANGSENFSTVVEGVGRVAAGTNATTVAATPAGTVGNTVAATPAGTISGEVDGAAAEVANATDLSGVTGLPLVVIGY